MSYQKLRVIAVEKQVAEVITISFEPLEGEKLDYQAGQFLPLVFQVNGKELRRSYSFFSSPVLTEPLSIAVKLVENGEISRLIHHQIAVNDIVEIAPPNGKFTFEPRFDERRTIFLFAAGVGITPLFSILKTALLVEPNAKVVLIYSSRSADETLFITEIAEWQVKYPDHLKVIHLFSNSKNLMRARLNRFLINELVASEMKFDKANAIIYTCGPVDYMDVCRISLLGAGFRPDQVRRETFVLPEDEVDEDDSTEKVVDKTSYTVNLNFGGFVHHLLIPYPKRILEVALENKIDLPYSCSGGVCSTCVATCISGGVKMTYNEVLTDDEVAKGRVLVCTARPTQNETTIVWSL